MSQLLVLGTKEVLEISASPMMTKFPEWEWFMRIDYDDLFSRESTEHTRMVVMRDDIVNN